MTDRSPPLYPPSLSDRALDWQKAFFREAAITAIMMLRKTSRAIVEPEFRSAVTTTKRTDYPGGAISKLLLLAPDSLAAAIIPMGTIVDLKGVASFSGFPIPASFTAASWVAEDAPIGVRMGAFVPLSLGQLKKLAMIATLSSEIEQASGELASQAIEYMLRVAIGRGLDAKLISSDPETTSSPPGLLAGATPLAGSSSMSKDLAALVGAISAAGLNSNKTVFVASAAQAMQIKLSSGPNFNFPVFASPAVADGTVIAIEPSGLLTAGEGVPKIDISRQSILHSADPASAISTPGSPNVVASPVYSSFQTNTAAIRAICRISWAIAPGAAQVITGTTWGA